MGEWHQPGRCGVGLPGEGLGLGPGGAAGGALPFPRCPRSRPRTGAEGGRSQPGSAGAARNPGHPLCSAPLRARRARARRRRAQGWAFPPFSPATERRDTRSSCRCMRLADFAWEGLGDLGEVASNRHSR